jgi:hypothetical protein
MLSNQQIQRVQQVAATLSADERPAFWRDVTQMLELLGSQVSDADLEHTLRCLLEVASELGDDYEPY